MKEYMKCNKNRYQNISKDGKVKKGKKTWKNTEKIQKRICLKRIHERNAWKNTDINIKKMSTKICLKKTYKRKKEHQKSRYQNMSEKDKQKHIEFMKKCRKNQSNNVLKKVK